MDQLLALAKTLHYQVFMVFGILGFEFLGETLPLTIFGFWVLFCVMDICLGWSVAIKANKNTSRDLKAGLVKKCLELLRVGLLTCLLAHVNYMVQNEYVSLLIGICTLGLPVLFLLSELQSNVENLLILTGYRNGALVKVSKIIGLANKFIEQKIKEKSDRVTKTEK